MVQRAPEENGLLQAALAEQDRSPVSQQKPSCKQLALLLMVMSVVWTYETPSSQLKVHFILHMLVPRTQPAVLNV
jgi:hypothetical protein